tara:strand:+ start:344 stop:595 length:252 start_codon:yes stop_codon:yes gene_type:complete
MKFDLCIPSRSCGGTTLLNRALTAHKNNTGRTKILVELGDMQDTVAKQVRNSLTLVEEVTGTDLNILIYKEQVNGKPTIYKQS